MIKEVKPLLTTGNYIAIWLCLVGLAGTALSRGNDIENQQIQTQSRQQEILRQQAEIKQTVKEAQKGQQEILLLLERIKSNQEK